MQLELELELRVEHGTNCRTCADLVDVPSGGHLRREVDDLTGLDPPVLHDSRYSPERPSWLATRRTSQWSWELPTRLEAELSQLPVHKARPVAVRGRARRARVEDAAD